MGIAEWWLTYHLPIDARGQWPWLNGPDKLSISNLIEKNRPEDCEPYPVSEIVIVPGGKQLAKLLYNFRPPRRCGNLFSAAADDGQVGAFCLVNTAYVPEAGIELVAGAG